MTGDWLRLGPDEAIRWEATPRTTRALPAVAGSLLLFAAVGRAAAAVSAWIALTLPLTAVPAAWALLRVHNTEFAVTDRGTYRKTGVLGRSVRRVEHGRVQNVTLSQGVAGSLFGYGTVSVDVAGGRDLRLFDVRDPGEPATLLQRVGDDDAGGVPGSTEQWEAVLAETRELRAAVEDAVD